ncbi:copper amine oxidase N-terminal domain-containing protein [Paenibacillus sp. BT-177]|uniref:copper amine oxidase N-terminal domain-containing protein n=1 Tax=Paenibacillus sp. BT-177 TaxID=2986930 RepID=UPI0021F6E6E6|nr:copper amine oxidase N-terminal domain-containing protein [Paenibacillus sp. BT-177]
MRRIFVSLLVSSCLLISGLLPTALSYAENSTSNLPVVVEDAAVFYLVPHQLTAELNKSSLSLDFVSIKTAPLLKRNNHLYFPFKWLETAHLATIKWDAKTGSTWAEFNTGNSVPFSSLRLMPNQSKIYSYFDGKMTALDESIPKTFMKNGQLYIPVSFLSKMGIIYTWNNGIMHWTWNDKIIKALHPTYTTDKENITFSALVQKEFGHAYLMVNTGDGGMTSSIGGSISTFKGKEKNIGKPIIMNGQTFQRIEYSVELRPGPNPLEIHTNDKGSVKIMVHRKVLNPSSIPIRYNHAGNEQDIRFTKPSQGYLRVKAGDSIAIAGVVMDTYIQSNEVSFGLAAFQNGNFVEDKKKTVIPLKQDKSFSGSVVIQKPGTYLVNILSPDVFVGGSSPYGSVKWAEIAVEVLPKTKKKP